MSRFESLPTGRRTLRWILWLAAGVAFGMLAGFVAALAANGPNVEGSVETDSGSGVSGANGGER